MVLCYLLWKKLVIYIFFLKSLLLLSVVDWYFYLCVVLMDGPVLWMARFKIFTLHCAENCHLPATNSVAGAVRRNDPLLFFAVFNFLARLHNINQASKRG